MPVRFEPSVDHRRARRTEGGAGGCELRVAFVNNMPAGAFADTERQFLSLLEAASGDRLVSVDGYVLAGIERHGVAPGYRLAHHLTDDPPDALIVTGTEPKRSSLPAEPYWGELSELLRWADGTVPSVLLSCLAAHAALLVLDGIERTPLPAKHSGVYPQWIDHHHPLVRGMGELPLPHSRYNDVPVGTMESHGYTVLAKSAEAGWSVATRDDGVSLLVLAQGHPEYSSDTLLREYRRDLRRCLEAGATARPSIPVGYLDQRGEHLLTGFAEQAAAVVAVTGAAGAGLLMESFPFDEAARHVRSGWRPAAERLMANWISEVAARTRAGVLR